MLTLNYLLYIYSHTYGYRSNSTNITKLTNEIYMYIKLKNPKLCNNSHTKISKTLKEVCFS